jgi:hypothetical protein
VKGRPLLDVARRRTNPKSDGGAPRLLVGNCTSASVDDVIGVDHAVRAYAQVEHRLASAALVRFVRLGSRVTDRARYRPS